MKYILVILLFNTLIANAQSNNDFAVITIETQSKKGNHKNQIDYWLVSLDLYVKPSENAFFPLYLTGFSVTDFNECCNDKNLTLFNVSTEESFEYDKSFIDSQKLLISMIKDNRKKIQGVKKDWTSGDKQRINIYITPVSGTFCFCKISNGSKIGYNDEIAMPVSSFEYNPSFWKSDIYKGVRKYDFSTLPFLSLNTIQ